MIVGDHQFGRRAQHAAAFHPAYRADRQRYILAGNESAGGREHAFHAGPCIGGATDDLNRFAVADVDHADAQAVRIRVLLSRYDRRNDKRLEQARRIFDVLDLEADHGELVDDLGQRFVGVEMFLEPGQREFHAGLPGE